MSDRIPDRIPDMCGWCWLREDEFCPAFNLPCMFAADTCPGREEMTRRADAYAREEEERYRNRKKR